MSYGEGLSQVTHESFKVPHLVCNAFPLSSTTPIQTGIGNAKYLPLAFVHTQTLCSKAVSSALLKASTVCFHKY